MISFLTSNSRHRRGALACFGLGAALIAPTMLVSNAFAQEALAPPQVTASSVYVLNADTGQPLYRKNEDKRYWILSITKLITAYVLVQRMGGQLSDTVTITQSDLARARPKLVPPERASSGSPEAASFVELAAW